MRIQLHKNARATPAIRRALQQSSLPTKELGERYGLCCQRVAKWRNVSITILGKKEVYHGLGIRHQ